MVTLLLGLGFVALPFLCWAMLVSSSHTRAWLTEVSWSDLWRWDGTVDRGTYLTVGLLGFALKHNIDRLAASVVFKRPWSVFNYVAPGAQGLQALSAADARFYACLAALSLPFVWTGVVMTLRRLRSAGLPLWLLLFFFMPFVNLLFFLLMALVPPTDAPTPARAAGAGLLARILPEQPLGSAAVAVLATAPFMLGATFLSIKVFRQYGWGVFVGLPFCLGLASALLHGYHRPRPLAGCVLVATLSVTLAGLILLAAAIEGMVCLAMAFPLAAALACLGGALGYLLQRRPGADGLAPGVLGLLVLVLPALMGAEYAAPDREAALPVVSAIEIAAPPAKVWRNVVSFSELPPPTHWLFKTGVAYPVRAEISGRGPGAVRRCEFSTGAFVEPIEVWDEPRLLRFSVASQPPPMREWNPRAVIHPPHLDGYLVSEGGQFLLTALPGGGTRLEGTTWYRHRIRPSAYWRPWSDFIIHRIHARVLEHIKRLSEADAA